MNHDEQYAAITAAFPGRKPVPTWKGSGDWIIRATPLWVRLEYYHYNKTWRVALFRSWGSVCLYSESMSSLSDIPHVWLEPARQKVEQRKRELAAAKAELRAVEKLACGPKYPNQTE